MRRDLRKTEEEEKWTVKTTGKIGGLCEERSKNGRGGRTLESKDHS